MMHYRFSDPTKSPGAAMSLCIGRLLLQVVVLGNQVGAVLSTAVFCSRSFCSFSCGALAHSIFPSSNTLLVVFPWLMLFLAGSFTVSHGSGTVPHGVSGMVSFCLVKVPGDAVVH